MLEAIVAVYNEEAELPDLITHLAVIGDLDKINFVNDGSIDRTEEILKDAKQYFLFLEYKTIDHTGLCEVARIHALEMCEPDSWVLMIGH